ncbi:MAG: efflux RND transporter permease subunit [Caulobacteraceae bacterium]
MIQSLIELAIRRRKVVLAVTLILTIFGLFTYLTMPRESNPDIKVPFVAVIVPYPGVSPEDSERLLVRPLETALQGLEGLKEMNATAGQNIAVVQLEFEVNFDPDKVMADVRAKVDEARGRFPPDAEEPIIEEGSVGGPSIEISVYGQAPERSLFEATRRLQDRLEALPGVLKVELSGARPEMLEVTIDPVRMQALNVTTGELAAVIARNNQLVPAGRLQTSQGAFSIKVPGVVERPEDILALPIKRNGDRLITVGDIGEVHRTFQDATFLARYNGQTAFTLDVTKRSGANALETVRAIRAAVLDEEKSWPTTVHSAVVFDDSEFIDRMLTMLEGGLISATLLVMVIVIASLGLRQGLMVGAAIPACFMIGLMVLHALDVTLNQMVMFGMVLAVGILVDGGIVVVEYADRKMAEGLPKDKAFAAAASRMFWPVINGTLTTLSAFIPFMFWNSIAGKFMSYLPLTLFFVLGASIFVALIFTPALGSLAGRKQGVDSELLEEIEKSEHGDPRQMKGFMGWYARVLWGAAIRPVLTTIAILCLIVTVFASFWAMQNNLLGMHSRATLFFLEEDPEWAQVFIKARGNLSVQAEDALVRNVEARLAGMPGVKAIAARVGGGGSCGGPNCAPNDTIGRLQVEFVSFGERAAMGTTGFDIVKNVRERLAANGGFPGVLTEVRTPQSGPPTGKDIQVELRSQNIAELNRAANLIRAHLAQDRQLIELEDNRTSPGIEWNLTVDREAAGRYGVDVPTIGQAIQFVTSGVLVGRFRPDDADDELDIRVRFPASSRNVEALQNLTINTPLGPVPASYFVKQVPSQQVTNIARRDGQRLVLIQANAIDGVAANEKIAALRPWLQQAGIDPSVHWKFTGSDEESQQAGTFFITAMAVTLGLMALILLWQFNSFYGIFVTLSAVVLSTVGVLIGVIINLLGAFNYISVIMMGTGIVALAGVVVGHNIVLVDTFYQLRRQGYDADEAAVRAATQRFRPVMLTTLVTVVGLLPLMFQIHPDFRNGGFEYKAPGSEWWVQLSSAVVWGLSFATLLTLFLTPVALAAPKTLSARFMWVMDKLGVRRKPTAIPKAANSPVPEAAE